MKDLVLDIGPWLEVILYNGRTRNNLEIFWTQLSLVCVIVCKTIFSSDSCFSVEL